MRDKHNKREKSDFTFIVALWGNETEIATIATSNGAATVYTDVKFGQRKDEKLSQNQLKHTATKFIIRREQKRRKEKK